MATKNTRKATVKLPRRAKFTIQDVIGFNPDYSVQTIRNFVRGLIGVSLEIVGTEPTGGRGRPRFVLAHAA